MKISGKMYFKIRLKVTKNQGSALSIEDTFFKKPQGGSNLTPPGRLGLRRIRKYLTLDKAKLLGNTFIDSQFNYPPLMLMFCHKTTYLKMQKIHHKTLKAIYQSDASYDDLLQLSNSVSHHQRHLRLLLTEIYKSTGTSNF